MIPFIFAAGIVAAGIVVTPDGMTVKTAVEIIVPTITSIGIFIAGLVYQTSRRNHAKIEAIALDVRELRTQISPFWASLQTKIANSLHNPDNASAALDNLLEKLEMGNLTAEESIILKLQLNYLKDGEDRDLSAKATALIMVMEMKLKETAGDIRPTDQRSMQQKNLDPSGR